MISAKYFLNIYPVSQLSWYEEQEHPHQTAVILLNGVFWDTLCESAVEKLIPWKTGR